MHRHVCHHIHGRPRVILQHVQERFNREIFSTLAEAKIVIEQWRREYNTSRVPSFVGYDRPRLVGRVGLQLFKGLLATRISLSRFIMRRLLGSENRSAKSHRSAKLAAITAIPRIKPVISK